MGLLVAMLDGFPWLTAMGYKPFAPAGAFRSFRPRMYSVTVPTCDSPIQKRSVAVLAMKTDESTSLVLIHFEESFFRVVIKSLKARFFESLMNK